MLKELIWKSFERTGKVDLYLLFKEFEGDSYHNIHELMAADEVAISN